jgi:hypothetical protein
LRPADRNPSISILHMRLFIHCEPREKRLSFWIEKPLMPGSFFMFLVSALAMERAISAQDPRVELIGTDAAKSAGCASAG